jgi:aminopeptidase N
MRPRPLLLALTAALAALTAGLPAQQAPPPEPLRTAGDRPFDVRHLRLDLRVDLPGKAVDGVATLDVVAQRRLSVLSLDAVEFTVRKVEIERGKEKSSEARFGHDGKKLTVELDRPLAAGEEALLRISYRVKEPRAGLYFFGPSKDDPDVPLTVWSQGEPITNRYWFPCLDQPNVRQSTELVVTVPAGFEVLSNGALVSKGAAAKPEEVTFHWKQEKPHPSYLVTLVVGKFDVVKEEWDGREGPPMPVLFYVPQGRKADVARTFGRTREMIAFFSDRFGINYPWEKYAQVVVEQFTAGGMENTSATTLTDRALHDERAMLDSSPDSLIAHELAHQWWGDMVTCRDWAHLWLNEGFASYSEALWDEHKLGADEYQATMLRKSRQAVAGGKERPVVDRRYAFPRSMFDARAYPKGAFVLHMLRQRLGEEAFWRGVQEYGRRNRFRSVETVELRRALESASGRDLERFFYDWTERPGHPVLEVTSEYEAEAKRLRVSVKQTQSAEPFHFPLTVRVVNGVEPVVHVEEITGRETQFTLPSAIRPTLVEIDPGLAVLAELSETKGRDWWLAQLTHGSTVASRTRAAEHLGKSKAAEDRAALAAALSAEKFWAVRVEVAHALGASGGAAARDALVAGLKADQPKVRRACAEQLGKWVGDAEAAKALKAVLEKGDPSYFVEAAALAGYARLKQPDAVNVLLPWLARPSHNEVLRTAALAGLGQTRDPAAVDVLVGWTKKGKPRQARTAALAALAKLAPAATGPQREAILTAVRACAEGETWALRRAAVEALRELAQTAPPAREALEALAQHDADERVQEAAKKALERPRGAASAEMEKLREEVERLKKEQQALRERLEKKGN